MKYKTIGVLLLAFLMITACQKDSPKVEELSENRELTAEDFGRPFPFLTTRSPCNFSAHVSNLDQSVVGLCNVKVHQNWPVNTLLYSERVDASELYSYWAVSIGSINPAWITVSVEALQSNGGDVTIGATSAGQFSASAGVTTDCGVRFGHLCSSIAGPWYCY